MIRGTARAGLFVLLLVLTPGISPAQAGRRARPSAAVTATAAATAATASRPRSTTLAQLGFRDGLALTGENALREVSFRIPSRGAVDSARLTMRVHFPRGVVAQSNVQMIAGGVAIGAVTRGDADSTGTAVLTASVPRSQLGGDYFTVTLKAASAERDKTCRDGRTFIGSVGVEAGSSFTYYASVAAITSIRQAWGALSDTISLALPNRRLTETEFRTAYAVGIAAEADGHVVRYIRLPRLGDVVVATAPDVLGIAAIADSVARAGNVAVFRFNERDTSRVGLFIDAARGAGAAALLTQRLAPLAFAASRDVRAATGGAPDRPTDPTLAELGITDLERDMGNEATWRIPLDIRQLPVGRVPSRAQIHLVTAPNTNDRAMVLFAFFNGVLIRTSDLSRAGGMQVIDLNFPSALVVTRNEVRLVLQRQLPPATGCAIDVPMPAQVQPSSIVYTTSSGSSSRDFPTVTALISESSALYLPDRALDDPAAFLPQLVPLGQAFWSSERAPTPRFYGSAARDLPDKPFVVVGRPDRAMIDAPVAADAGRFMIRRKSTGAPLVDIPDLRDWSVVQIVRWNKHLGVQLIPGNGRGRVPGVPAAYAAGSLVVADGDSTVLHLDASRNDPDLLFNDGPTITDRIRRDGVLWTLFLLLLLGPAIVSVVQNVRHRLGPGSTDITPHD